MSDKMTKYYIFLHTLFIPHQFRLMLIQKSLHLELPNNFISKTKCILHIFRFHRSSDCYSFRVILSFWNSQVLQGTQFSSSFHLVYLKQNESRSATKKQTLIDKSDKITHSTYLLQPTKTKLTEQREEW